MTVLVDTGVLYADHDTDATRHEAAGTALEAVYDGKLGQPYVSEYVYDEAVTLAFRRGGSFEAAASLGKRLRGVDPYPSPYEILHVSPSTFRDAVETFEQFDDQSLSFTDAVQVTQVKQHDVDGILSFDDDFDGIVERIAPEDVTVPDS